MLMGWEVWWAMREVASFQWKVYVSVPAWAHQDEDMSCGGFCVLLPTLSFIQQATGHVFTRRVDGPALHMMVREIHLTFWRERDAPIELKSDQQESMSPSINLISSLERRLSGGSPLYYST